MRRDLSLAFWRGRADGFEIGFLEGLGLAGVLRLRIDYGVLRRGVYRRWASLGIQKRSFLGRVLARKPQATGVETTSCG